MNFFTKSLFVLCALSAVTGVYAQQEEETIRIYDHIVFYDGYLMYNIPNKDADEGVLKFKTSLYSVKLTDEQIDKIGDKLDLNVFVTAACDNYDRIGNINLAFVEKGKTTYTRSRTGIIEIARFITPFMDKNKEPSTVPYNYNMDYLSLILKDKELREKYDFWIEYELFGIPYAANQQIKGCGGRNDVFQGTLEFVTSGRKTPTSGNIVVPIVLKKDETVWGNLNNYNKSATDTIGKTTKTYTFTVPEDVTDAQIVLITSNHGANSGGEEYNRRNHFVYYEDELVLMYKPGRDSCEPFRKYNTQANGIYQYSPMSDKQWQSFSNWCPGDAIDNRIIQLGEVKAGEHKIRISVPDAKFAGQQGDIPVSMYFHGVKEGTITSGVVFPTVEHVDFKITENGNYLNITSEEGIIGVDIYAINGERKYSQEGGENVPIASLPKGIYLVSVEFDSGVIETRKMLLNAK